MIFHDTVAVSTMSFEQNASPEKKLELEVFAVSVGGELRKGETTHINQDRFIADAENALFAVFDGMGGENGGDIAAEIARRITTEKLSALPENLSDDELKEYMKSALETANAEILKKAAEDPTLKEMGSTASVLKLYRNAEGKLRRVIGHIGDSRIYVKRKDSDEITALTLDDKTILRLELEKNGKEAAFALQKKFNEATKAEDLSATELETFNQRNVIEKALGMTSPTFDISVEDADEDDEHIITSDGVHDDNTDSEMAAIIKKGGLRSVPKQLEWAAAARQKEGSFRSKKYLDDITIVYEKRTA